MAEDRSKDPRSPAQARGSSRLRSRIAARLPRRRQENPPGEEFLAEPASEPAGRLLRWPADRPHPVLIAVEKKGVLDRLAGIARLGRQPKEEPPAPVERSADFTTFRREPGGAITLVWPPRPLAEPEQPAPEAQPAVPLPEAEQPDSLQPVREEAEPARPAAEKAAPAERTARKRRVRRGAEPAGSREAPQPPASDETRELPAEETIARPATEPVAGDGAELPAEETVAGSAALSPGTAAESEPEGAEDVEDQPPAADRTATYAPIPDRIGEPLRGMLVREQQVLHQLENAFGPDDPGVLNSRSNLAYYLVSAGEYARAVLVQEKVASETARVLGDKHPHTLTARTRLDQWRKLAKKHRRSRASVSA